MLFNYQITNLPNYQISSKRLPDTEIEIKVSQRVRAVLLRNGKKRRIQVVSQIKTDRPNRGAVTDPTAHRMRNVVEITIRRDRVQAGTAVGLHIVEKTVQNVARIGEHISHVVKHDCAHIIPNKGQGQGWRAQFNVVQEQGLAAEREPGLQIARAGLIEPETTMRVAASGEKSLRKRNEVG